ncbi:MAG: DUF2752 domain-containing protein [Streptosporangiales bacterium]|nr:DUF2752 domain-containing protein [Streptosporangiales bacterium]
MVQLRVEAADRHRGLFVLAVGGLLVGAAMAVFGLPPLDLHGPLHNLFGIMDPLCGGTRGVYSAMRGDVASAWAYNPASIPLVLGALTLVVRHVAGWLTGRWLTVRLRPRWLVVTVAVVLVVALGVNQQLHADLLMRP